MHCVSSYDSLKTVRDPVHGTGWEKDILGPGYSKGVGRSPVCLSRPVQRHQARVN
jgi:hypothetical protein